MVSSLGRCRVMFSVACLVAAGGVMPAEARQVPPDYGYSWAVIGAPGNRPTLPSEVPWQPQLRIGSVPQSFRMATTEVTVEQWAEFANAYLPFNPDPGSFEILSRLIYRPGQGYTYFPDEAQWPADASWRMAARYCNWLHNGKALTRDAFERGVYDSSTFRQGENGWYLDQRERSPGATFFLPTTDEWVKAMYFDPNKYGPGREGYWLNPSKSDTTLRWGPPDQGGQTNAGPWPDFSFQMPVGSYPAWPSPWGVLDGSGGEKEWGEGDSGINNNKSFFGTRGGDATYTTWDRLDVQNLLFSPPIFQSGIRLASIVPSPSVAAPLAAFVLCVSVRRRTR